MKPPPLIVVEPSSDDGPPQLPKYELFGHADSEDGAGQLLPSTTAKILSTKWYGFTDDAVRSAVSALAIAPSPTDNPEHPYYAIMRVLSSAVHSLTRARHELEESRRTLIEKEAARKERARQLLQELPPTEKEIGDRLFQSLFPDDDESLHQVHRMQRQTSLMVRALHSIPVNERFLLKDSSLSQNPSQRPSKMRCPSRAVFPKRISPPWSRLSPYLRSRNCQPPS